MKMRAKKKKKNLPQRRRKLLKRMANQNRTQIGSKSTVEIGIPSKETIRRWIATSAGNWTTVNVIWKILWISTQEKKNLCWNFLCHLMAYYSHNLMNNKDIMDLGIQFQEIMAEHPVERDMYIGKAWKEQKVAWIEHVNKKAKDPTIIEKKKRKEAPILVDLPSQDTTSKDSTDTIFISDVCGEQIGQNGHSNEQDISEGETDNEVTIDDIVDEEVSFSPSPSKRKKFKRMEPSSDIMSSKTYPILERPDDQREAEILKMRTLIFEGYDPYTGIPLV